MTWVILVWTGIMAAWGIAGIARASRDDPDCGDLDEELCNSASDVGSAIGAGLIALIWFGGFVVLSLVWLMSRPREQPPPVLAAPSPRLESSSRRKQRRPER